MFRSFFIAGFEGATGFNERGEWIDQVASTHHDQHAEEDYARLHEAGLYAAREAIRWPIVDRGGQYDFSSIEPFLTAARRYDVTLIWDLFHYGYPSDVDIFSEAFPPRFAAYCGAVARHLRDRGAGPFYFTPVNEPSYFAWAGGEAGRFAPHARGRGPELKRMLARAAIAGINAIRAEIPGARMVNVDPICNMVAPLGRTDLAADVAAFNAGSVFESWDIIAGRLLPELGGSRAHLDIVGVNYYWTNQWEMGSEENPLPDDDPRRLPLHVLLRRVWERYGGELLVTETAHVHEQRPSWMNYVASECERLLDEGVPLRGVCLYPILGMPKWHAPEEWVPMGLWDISHDQPTRVRRRCEPMWLAFREAQRIELRHALAR